MSDWYHLRAWLDRSNAISAKPVNWSTISQRAKIVAIFEVRWGLLATDDSYRQGVTEEPSFSKILVCKWEFGDRQKRAITDDYGLCDVFANLRQPRTFSHSLELYKRMLTLLVNLARVFRSNTYALRQCDCICVFAVNLGEWIFCRR
jgi:hypothetical protein